MASMLLLVIFIYFSALFSVRADLSNNKNDKSLEIVNTSWPHSTWTTPNFNTAAMSRRRTIRNDSVDYDKLFSLLRSYNNTSNSIDATYPIPWYKTEPVSEKPTTEESLYATPTDELNYTETPSDADTTYLDWTTPRSNITWEDRKVSYKHRYTTTPYFNWTSDWNEETEPDSTTTPYRWTTSHSNQSYRTTTNRPQYTSTFRPRWTTPQYIASTIWKRTTPHSKTTTPIWNGTMNGDSKTTPYWFLSRWTTPYYNASSTNYWERLWYLTMPHPSRTADWNGETEPDSTTTPPWYTSRSLYRWTTSQYNDSNLNWITFNSNRTPNGNISTYRNWNFSLPESKWTLVQKDNATTNGSRLWYTLHSNESNWTTTNRPQYTRTFRVRWTAPQYRAASSSWNRTWNRTAPYSNRTTSSGNETVNGDTNITPYWFNSRWTRPYHKASTANWNRPWYQTTPFSTPNWNETSGGTEAKPDFNPTTTNWNRILNNTMTTLNRRNTTTPPQQLVNINMGIKIIIIQNNTNVNVNIN